MGVELDLQYPFSWDVTMWFKKRTSYGVYIHIYTIIPYIYMTIHYHTLYGVFFLDLQSRQYSWGLNPLGDQIAVNPLPP